MTGDRLEERVPIHPERRRPESTARTDAVRGMSLISAISPTPSPAPPVPSSALALADLDLAVVDEEVVVAASPSRISHVPASNVDRHQGCGQVFDGRQRQRREERLAAQQLDAPGRGRVRPRPTPRAASPSATATSGSSAPVDARAPPACRHAAMRSGATIPPRAGPSVGDAVDQPEHGDAGRVRRRPLDEREPGDVEDSVADADRGHGHDRRGRVHRRGR